jgi:hypothetical protein
MRIYDSPGCDDDDDWTEIQVRQNVARFVVGTFEQTRSDSVLRMIFHRDNGLDGKVSCIAVP